MNIRTSWLALVLVTVGANASAATVTFTLDLTGPPGIFKLTAADSLGDNGGIASYGIPLTGPILSLNHRAPYAVSTANFAPSGFSNLRSADGVPYVFAGQPLTGPVANYLYGMGQTPNNFWALGITPAGLYDHPDWEWLAPLVIATGTYNPALGTLGFNTTTSDLFSNVFESAGNSFPRIAAQVVTRVLLIPEPATCVVVVAAISMLSVRRK